jgi:hypothetical protein
VNIGKENDMPRYTDIDKLIAEYDRVHVGPAGGARKLMVEAPIADVAPRAEIAREIFEEIESLFPSDKNFTTISRVTINRLKNKYAEGEDTNVPTKKDYYTPEEVRNMYYAEILNNLTVIRESMKRWREK